MTAIEADLQIFNEARADEAALHLKSDWLSDEECPSRWYLNQARNNGAAATISKLSIPNVNRALGAPEQIILHEQTEIRDYVGRFSKTFLAPRRGTRLWLTSWTEIKK